MAICVKTKGQSCLKCGDIILILTFSKRRRHRQ